MIDPLARCAPDAHWRSRVIRGATSNYVGRAVSLVTWFVLTPFMLHRLGAEDYGLWILIGAVTAYGGLLDLGVATAITKYTAECIVQGNLTRARRLIATSLHLYGWLGLLVIVSSVALAPLVPMAFNISAETQERARWLTVIMGTTVGLAIPGAATAAVLRGLQRYDLVNLVSVVGTVATAAATVSVLLLDGGVVAMTALNIPILVALQGLSVLLTRRVAPGLLSVRWRHTDLGSARTIVSFSWALFVVDVGSRLQTKTDEIVIGAFLPISYVAPYAIARRLSQLAHTLSEQFIKVLLPVASELHASREPSRLRALFVDASRITLALYVPLGCLIVLLAHQILEAWVGADLAAHENVVAILAISGFASIAQWPAGIILQGMARHRWLAASAICSGVANLVISVALVQHMGLVGVALGTLIPTVAECVGFVLPYGMWATGVRPSAVLTGVLVPTLVPAIPMVAVLLAIRSTSDPAGWVGIAFATSIACLVYAAGYVAIGPSRPECLIVRGWVVDLIGSMRSRVRPVRGVESRGPLGRS